MGFSMTGGSVKKRLLLYAYRLLALKSYSETELVFKLSQKFKDDRYEENLEALVSEVIEELRRLHFIDDRSVARVIAHRRGVGRLRKAAEMRLRGIDP